ncbi:MAG: hypothetical protein WCB27_01745 [Thermoguttaceae bacterium]
MDAAGPQPMLLCEEIRLVGHVVPVRQDESPAWSEESFLGPIQASLPNGLVDIVPDGDLLAFRKHRQGLTDVAFGKLAGGLACPFLFLAADVLEDGGTVASSQKLERGCTFHGRKLEWVTDKQKGGSRPLDQF